MSLPAPLPDGALNAPCEFREAFLLLMLGRKQQPLLQPQVFCLCGAQLLRQKLQSAPCRSGSCHRHTATSTGMVPSQAAVAHGARGLPKALTSQIPWCYEVTAVTSQMGPRGSWRWRETLQFSWHCHPQHFLRLLRRQTGGGSRGAPERRWVRKRD